MVLVAAAKLERGRGIAVENAHAVHPVRNDLVSELLANGREVGVAANLPLVTAAAPGKVCVHVGFAETAILMRGDGRRERVRPKPRVYIAKHPAHRAQQRGG